MAEYDLGFIREEVSGGLEIFIVVRMRGSIRHHEVLIRDHVNLFDSVPGLLGLLHENSNGILALLCNKFALLL